MNSLFKLVTDGAANSDLHVTQQSIQIRDMEIMMSIGVLDEEKQKPQRVLINIDLEIDKNARPEADNIDEVISYTDIMESIEALSKTKHYELVEAFANDVAATCLNMDERALKAKISVQKPDIVKNANVGVTISAQK